jgi:hypothetical protein
MATNVAPILRCENKLLLLTKPVWKQSSWDLLEVVVIFQMESTGRLTRHPWNCFAVGAGRIVGSHGS